MIKKFLSGSQFYIYSAYLPILLSLFTLPLITPYLSLRDYGVYGLLYSFYTFITLIFNLGFTVEYQNAFFNEPGNYKKLWAKIAGFQVIWNFITAIPIAIIIGAFIWKEVSTTELIVSLACLIIPYLFLDPIKEMGSRHVQYSGRHKRLFFVTISGTFCQYIMILILIIHFKFGFLAWFIGNLSNALVISTFHFLYLRSNNIFVSFNFSLKKVRYRIKTQTSIVLHNLSGYILETSDRILLSLFNVPIAQIGAYNIAYNYSNYGQTVNNAMNTVFSPMYFNSIKKNETAMNEIQLAKLFRFWVIVIFFLAVNMIVWADYLFAFLYRNQSLNNTFIFAFPMIIALLYRPFYVMVVDNLIIQEKRKYIVTISLTSAAMNIVLNIFLIPTYGIMATVYSTAISYVFLGFSGLIIGKIRKELTHVYFKNYVPVLFILIALIILVPFANFEQLTTKIVTILITLFFIVGTNRKLISEFIFKKAIN